MGAFPLSRKPGKGKDLSPPSFYSTVPSGTAPYPNVGLEFLPDGRRVLEEEADLLYDGL